MRNLALAWTYAQAKSLKPGFVLVYADDERLPMAQKVRQNKLDECLEHLKPNTVAFASASYQNMLAIADQAAQSNPFQVEALTTWVYGKIEHIADGKTANPGTFVGLSDLASYWEVALIALRRAFGTMEEHEAAIGASKAVRKQVLTDDRAFERKYPDRPLAVRNRFTRLAAADFFRDVARDQGIRFPQEVLDRSTRWM